MHHARRIFHRATALLYAVALGLSLLTAVMVAGATDIRMLAWQQAQGAHRWLLFHDPFNMAACLLYFAASLICCRYSHLTKNFPPFQSPPRRALAFLLCTVQAILWLGAWYDPFGLLLRLQESHSAAPLIFALAAALVLTAKTLVLMALQTLARRSLPEWPAHQLDDAAVRILLPLGCGDLMAAAAYLWLVEPLADFQKNMRIVLACLGLVGTFAILIFIVSRRHGPKPASQR